MSADEVVTLAELLPGLPPTVAAEFTCVGGPHAWRELSASGVTHFFCLNCTRVRRRVDRVPTPMHFPLEAHQ